ncbi:MAG: hypothetical protein HF314_16620 [Ignavibacteria bacterium]|nr:hypothetical protein [Ignavibacteria bacterium]MCU7504708.1 hypothetical protein [Ignavibacteria bacterium]MCU7516310.1 hypothetical protein [Ignavibacteria bacterium]
MKKNFLSLKMLLAALLLIAADINAQQDIDAPLLTFTRGKLWHSLFFGKSGPGSFNNWAQTGIGWDWPGFDVTKIQEDIDGSASYMATGGMYIGCKNNKDSVLACEDWSIYSSSISSEVTAKYKVIKHKKYSDNWGMQKRSNGGEETIETVWQYNPNFPNQFEPQRQLPLRVRRTAHQWNGSMSDENYIIYEYVIKNISNELSQYKEERKIADTLYGFYAMFNYAINCNSRSWRIFYPELSQGARNTKFRIDNARRMVYGWAGSYKEDPYSTDLPREISYAFSASRGEKIKDATGKVSPSGEWLAPGFAGVKLLYSTPDKINRVPSKINKIAWSAADNGTDLGGPLTGKSGLLESYYSVLQDPANAYSPVTSSFDPLMGSRRLWTMMSLGPWDIAPGDSIVIAVAELVDGIDYSKCTGPDMYQGNAITMVGLGRTNNFEPTADKAQFTYDNGLRHPNPPMAPSFKVNFFKGIDNFVANEITWTDSCENIPDPDDGIKDLAGYRLYRSEYLPIGPWKKIAEITKHEDGYYSDRNYAFVDSTVEIGTRYYYALTAFDNGRTSWNINPAAVYPGTHSTQVPPLESSVYANRLQYPFVATLAPPKTLDNVLVVPNPFVIGEGSSQPGDADLIQFVNIPNPCTIRIYSVRGDLIKTIKVEEGQGAIASWNQATDFGQFVTSGIYVYHIESPLGSKIGKLAIVR